MPWALRRWPSSARSGVPFTWTTINAKLKALDEVDGLGTFVELELSADEASLDEARRTIVSLANELDLGPSERRSYLEMLLEQ